MKNKIIILLFVLGSFSASNAQSGFLGSTLNVNTQIEVVPVVSSFWSPNYTGFKQSSSGYIKLKKTLVDYKFSSSVNKVLNDDFELGITFNYSSFGVIADEFIGVDTNKFYYGYTLEETQYSMLNVIKAKSTGFSVNFKKFNKGLSPIGKFIGLNVGLSRTVTKKNAAIEYGDRNLISSRFLSRMYSVESSNSTTLDYRANVNTFNVNYIMGRTIPINKKVGVDLAMSVPIFRILFFNNQVVWARSVQENSGEINANSEYELNRSVAYSIRRNQGFSISFGVKYFI